MASCLQQHRRRRLGLLASGLGLLGCWLGGAAHTGEALDDILNTFKLDAHTGGAPDFDHYLSIHPGAPVGQAFTLGEGAGERTKGRYTLTTLAGGALRARPWARS